MFWAEDVMKYIQSVVIGVSYFGAAWKITRSQPFSQIDRQVILIWVLSVVTVILDMVSRCYYKRSLENENTILWLYFTLNAFTSFFINITIWEFSFQLFNVSVEIEERLSKKKHTLTKRARRNSNIGVAALILVSFIVGLGL